jgi:two-component system, OmpR family, alkaline phosphatase synthesis response regulator PhoP
MSNDSTTPARVRRTVIIADDAPANRMLASAIIGTDDFNVVEAHDGIEAWSLIQELRPSVVLLDVRMPGRNGLDILRAIKSDPNLTATRVILLTASAEESEISAGWAAGADSYLTKPFSAEDLLSRLNEALEL